MNLSEFKAWFEGFTDGIDSNPSEKQWAKIKEKVSTITADATPPTVIREYWRDYWPRIQPYYDRWWYGGYGLGVNAVGSQISNAGGATLLSGQCADPAVWQFNTQDVVDATFKAIGDADREALN